MTQRRIVVPFISETQRKDGDKHDPYAIFTKLVTSGLYEELVSKLR